MLLLNSCSGIPSSDSAEVENPTLIGEAAPTPIPCPTPPEERQKGTGTIAFKGVTLRSYVPEAQTIEAVLVPPVCLDHEYDKPDGIAPQHVSLKLKELEPPDERRTFYDSEIVIFPIDDFRTVLANSNGGFEYVQDQMKTFRRILKDQPSIPKDLPDPQIYDDGSPDPFTHVKYARFNGINGVFYLAHFDIEPALIGNHGLTYVFQGLTDDGNEYVCATFPVMLGWLPDGDANAFDGYTLPNDYYSHPEKQKQYDQDRDRYISHMRKRLEATPPEQYRPSLISLEQTVRSIKID
jgi:hypothetical protein